MSRTSCPTPGGQTVHLSTCPIVIGLGQVEQVYGRASVQHVRGQLGHKDRVSRTKMSDTGIGSGAALAARYSKGDL